MLSYYSCLAKALLALMGTGVVNSRVSTFNCTFLFERCIGDLVRCVSKKLPTALQNDLFVFLWFIISCYFWFMGIPRNMFKRVSDNLQF